MLALLLVATASAAPGSCSGPYTSTALLHDIQAFQSALRGLDDDAFEAAGERLEHGLPCLDTVASPQVYATVYRYIGAWYWLIPAEDHVARSWFRASLELEPGYEWDVDEMPARSPLRGAWDEERISADADLVVAVGKVLVPGEVYVDGRRVTTPAVTPGRPHVVQLEVEGEPVVTWRIDAPELPDGVLADPAPVEDPTDVPRRVARAVAPTRTPEALPGSGYAVVQVQRTRPPAKTPLLVAGGVGVVAAGGVYGLAMWSRGEFDATTTTADAEALRTRTNALVVASGGALVAGLGLGAWAIALDGGGVAGISGQF